MSPDSEEHAEDSTMALSPLQEVWLGQEMSQLQGRAQTLPSLLDIQGHPPSSTHSQIIDISAT